jgi:hypothetical protein
MVGSALKVRFFRNDSLAEAKVMPVNASLDF